MTTKITPSVLENTAVVAATHGNGATIPVIVVDPQGRITGVTNTTIGIATSQITSGTIADARLPNSGVTADSYGSASRVPRIIVDAKGRATGVANIDIQIATSQITGYPTFAASATTDTTNAGNISSGTLPDARLSNAGVNSGSFGSASAVPAITVDAKGRVTAVTATNIAIASSAVSGLATSATTDTTNAGNISSGTLPDARLSNAGTNTGLFGTASVVPRINVDAKGRVTSVTATSIAIAAGSVSGLATVATSGSYTDLSGRPSVPAAQVNSDWNAASGVAQILNKPSLATVATTGSYNDLSSKPTIPTIPTNISSFTNDSGYLTSSTSFGGNQTWQNVLASRGRGVTYTNSTGRPIGLSISVDTTYNWFLVINGVTMIYIPFLQTSGGGFTEMHISSIVPTGGTYYLEVSPVSGLPILKWFEFR